MPPMHFLHDLFSPFFPVFYGENDMFWVGNFCVAAKTYFVWSQMDIGIRDWQVFLFCANC